MYVCVGTTIILCDQLTMMQYLFSSKNHITPHSINVLVLAELPALLQTVTKEPCSQLVAEAILQEQQQQNELNWLTEAEREKICFIQATQL